MALKTRIKSFRLSLPIQRKSEHLLSQTIAKHRQTQLPDLIHECSLKFLLNLDRKSEALDPCIPFTALPLTDQVIEGVVNGPMKTRSLGKFYPSLGISHVTY